MAALTSHAGVLPQRGLRLVEAYAPTDGRSATIVSLDARRRQREVVLRRRRLVALAACVAILAITWFATGAIAGGRATALTVLPGSTPVAHGYQYTVQPGDTVWAIATRLSPSGDPRPIVAQIDARLGSPSIIPGEQIFVP